VAQLGAMIGFSFVMPFVRKRGSVIDRPTIRRHPSRKLEVGLPIVLVHGLACNRGNWFLFRRRLERAGCSAFALDYTPWFSTIDTYGPQLAAAIDEVLAATGAPRVIVVAHSMGGLVTRTCMARFGADKVAHVVTLGTPHQGTWMTRFGFTPNVRNMAEGSAWLADLRSREAARSSKPYARFTCLFTCHDNLVTPQHNATLPGATNIPLSGVGHVSLVLSRNVFERVLGVCRAVA
jgi:pimeloyl-ACP methyl ester carboxylesterase